MLGSQLVDPRGRPLRRDGRRIEVAREIPRDDVMRCAPMFQGGGSNGRMPAMNFVLPNAFAKTAIWMRGDLGRTIVKPTAPQDVSAWPNRTGILSVTTTTGPGGSGTAYTITEDTSTGTHVVSSGAITNARSDQIGTSFYSIYAKQGSGTRYLQMYEYPGANCLGTFDLINGVIIGSTGATPDMQYVDGTWWLCSILIAGNSSGIYLYLKNGGATSYAGDGTSSITVYNPVLTQDGSASDWANQGNDAARVSTVSQGTFSKEPLVATANGRSALYFDATKSSQLSSGGAFGGSGAIAQTFTAWVVGTATNTGSAEWFDGITSRAVLYSSGASFPKTLLPYAGAQFNGGTINSGTVYCVAAVFNGASSTAYINGVLSGSGNASTNSLNGLLVGGGTGSSYVTGYILELGIYAGDAVADGAFTPISNYARAWYGLP